MLRFVRQARALGFPIPREERKPGVPEDAIAHPSLDIWARSLGKES